MAFPKWITSAGNLGIVPELEYYQFSLDAYDENLFQLKGNITANSAVISDASNLDYLITGQSISGFGIPNGSKIVDVSPYGNLITISANATATVGNLTISTTPIRYDRISGVLPEGIQIIPTGRLVGIPISTPRVGADKNEEYTFSIRATNIYTGNVSDRTFNLTITNVAPPIITPKTVVNTNQLQLVGNISANIGDYLTQSISGANAQILTGIINSSIVKVAYILGSPSFTLGSGNLRVVSGNVSLYPTVSVDSYPVSTTIISTNSTRDLGLFFDGVIVNLQLEAIEFANSATLSWSVKSGDNSLPPGLSLSPSGLLSGYITPIPTVGPSSDPGWSDTPWDLLGWDFPLGTTSKNFSWDIEVTDGINYDVCTYSMLVYPRRYFTADSTLITVDATSANTLKLSVDTGSRHYPIILSTQDDLPPERESGYFSFKIDALDLDEDVLQYAVPAISSGSFDEQTLTTANSKSYIPSSLITGNLYQGVFPKTTIVNISTLELFLGYTITANVGDYITQPSTGANSRVYANVVSSDNIPISIVSGIFNTGTGNLNLNGTQLIRSSFIGGSWSNVGIVPAAVVTGQSISVDNTSPQLLAGDQIQVLQFDPVINSVIWYNGTVNNHTAIRLSGNTVISANVGNYITQAIGNANATISNISTTTGTIYFGGNSLVGALTIFGDVLSANVGDYITQPSTGANATITANVIYAVAIPVVYTNGSFAIEGGNIQVNGSNVSAYPYSLTISPQPVTFSANAGDVITQSVSGATATVLETQPGGTSAVVTFNSNVFTLGSGNLTVNSSNINLYPTSLSTQVDISAIYNNSNYFKFNTSTSTSIAYINGVSTGFIPSKVISVGVDIGAASTQGTIGYDEGKFDQGVLSLPQGLSIDVNSGWVTGQLPLQTVNEIVYDFNVEVYKRDYPGYSVNKQYNLTVLGDLNNTINWLTPSYLGTIENGTISDLFVKAISSKGKSLYYEYAENSLIRLPQGLQLISNGIISGRVSFEVFSLDQSLTTIDSGTTTFDNTYTFNVTARDFDQTIAASRTFTITVLQRNIIPYENLYLKALTSREQRLDLQNILQDKTVFPLDLIYRNEDPFYGISNDIKTLFLPGLNPSTLAHYAAAVSTNHFNKRINFGQIKTAIATDGGYNVVELSTGATVGTYKDNIGFIPTDFSLGYTAANSIPAGTKLGSEHIKYEVVYAEVFDDNTNSFGFGPSDEINLTDQINPYYDNSNNPYYIAYPNSFENMSNVIISGSNAIGYINKGALPDWMTSKQTDGRVLGFTRAVVLAHTVEGGSSIIAYRLQQSNFKLNQLDFTVDRYQLDNNYTTNYNILANTFITSTETTFDRYVGLTSVYSTIGTVDYAVNISFEEINERSIASINLAGGFDGIKSFTDGEKLVFFNQEFATGVSIGDTYNLGWSNVKARWGAEPWDYDNGTVSSGDDLAWDAASYVTGYNENLLDPSIANQRIGIWQIHIDSDDIVSLTFVQTVNFYNTLFVRNGFTHGATNIYYDPTIKSGLTVPNYSIIPQQINTVSTRFDGNGTKFLTYRDSYSVPEQGDKYIKFAKTGVFT